MNELDIKGWAQAGFLADGTPTVLDDREYHADVKRGVVVVAHAVGTDGSLSLSLRTPNAAAGLGVGGVCV